MPKEKFQIGIMGCGTVGSGLVKLLRKHLLRKQSPEISIAKILVRNDKRAAEISSELGLDQSLFTTNADDIVKNPDIDFVVELMGGVDHTKKLLLSALENKKSIVTANKDLLALEGKDLFEAAKTHGQTIMFEAAVAGGIPVIATLKQSLKGNHVTQILGIINGTTNYILDVMKNQGRDFEDVLKQAQELGFAESDPVNDVDGHDAAYKTAILASIISGKRIDVNKVYREGIRNISQHDIKSADKRGYEIKLLGIINNDDDKVDARVHPVFVAKENPIAGVRLENNAVLINGDAVQELTLIGKGAGSLPTASSVFADVLMLASQMQLGEDPNPQYVCQHNEYAELKPIEEVENSFYIRVSMHDKVGVLKAFGELTEKYGANVKFIDQYDVSGEEAHADLIFDPIKEKSFNSLIEDMKALDAIKAIESVVRVL